MELRRLKLLQELREAREELLNINFSTDTVDTATSKRISVSRPFALVEEWSIKWNPTFERLYAITDGKMSLQIPISRTIGGYRLEDDSEIFNELRPILIGYIDQGISLLDQEYQVKPVLEEYIKRVKDTKLAELLKEFNVSKDTSPNLVAIGFRTILALIIQEKAKGLNPQSNTAARIDIALEKMIDSARNDNVLSSDELRLLDSFKATHKDAFDFVAHRPGANKMVDKNEVETMVDLLNKLLPAIIN